MSKISKFSRIFNFNPPADRVEYFKTHSSVSENMWDPIGKYDSKLILNNCAELRADFEKLKNNPDHIKKVKFGLTILGILLFLGLFFAGGFIYAVFALILPVMIYKGILNAVSVDLIKLEIAEEKGWAYDPKFSSMRWRDLKLKFPQIFNKGNSSQNIEDQFWGTVDYKNKKYPFHAGLFTYTVQHNKSSTTYDTNYFAVKINSTLKSAFYLYPENAFSKLGNLFTKKEINTESIEFNKTFAFSYAGKKDDHALNIVKALSPAVQQKLIDLKKRKGTLEVLFDGDTFLVLFKGKLMPKLKTDFSKSLVVDAQDKKQITDELDIVLNLSTEMLHYIR